MQVVEWYPGAVVKLPYARTAEKDPTTRRGATFPYCKGHVPMLTMTRRSEAG